MPLSEEQRDNWGQQLDELLALASIYGEDFQLLGAEGVVADRSSGGGGGGGGGVEEAIAATAAAAAAGSSYSAVEGLSACEPPQEAWALDCGIAVQLEPPGGRLLLQLPQDGGTSGSGSGGGGGGGESQEAAEVAAGGAAGGGGFSVRYLPPISLQLRLHPAYPSAQAPQLLALSAPWLSPAQSALLAQQLEELWGEQGPGLPICFTWADWLQSAALQHLGAAERLVLGGGGGGGDSSGGGDAGEAAGSSRASSRGGGESPAGGSQRGGEQEESGDLREEGSPEQILFNLLRYDAAREHQEFQRSMHTCSICFEDQPGTSFVRLDCRHAFCLGCVGEQCRLHVREGSLDALKCPEPKCGASLSPQVLKRVLPAEEFSRWEQLTLQKSLDRMSDAAYCPRCSTVSLEDEDNCAQCPKCFFVFCTLCNEGWHPGVQCVSAETRLAMLQRKLAGGGATSIQELRRKEQEMMSLAAIEGMSKKCPQCSMAIQKSEGCNKMTCTNCSSFFCFKCGKLIKGYDHFKNGECVLFDEAEILRWEQQWEDQVQRVAFGEARNEFFMQQQLALLAGFGQGGGGGAARGGGGRERLRGCHCPQCGQVCYKMGNNNHMSCWSCTQHFCYLCRQVLRGKGSGGAHFGPKGCRQHTSD